MKTSTPFHVFTVFIVTVASLFAFVPTARAIGSATTGTTLTILPPKAVTVGEMAAVDMRLISSKGNPVANQRVDLFINGVHQRAAKTDASGKVSIGMKLEEVGTYKLYATFKGSKFPSLGSSKASAELVITPATVEIATTPPLSGVKFLLDDQVFSSDAHGIARIQVKKAGTYPLEVLPIENQNSDLQMNFGRWEDEFFEPKREIEVPMKKSLLVGFEVSYQVRPTFVDLDSQPVDPSRITSVTMKGSNGATFTFDDTEAHWLPAGRVIRLNNGLQETKILYSVMSVVIDGSNVVSQAQQRFYAEQNDVWTIKVLLYQAHFTARDALFGFPIGSGIRMEYPDGEVQSYSFDPSEGYTISGLARGIYKVTVTGANGYAPATPIALSRDQDVELMVFSYLDMGVFLAVGIFLSVGLLLLGRPYLLKDAATAGRRLLPGRRGTVPAVQSEDAHSGEAPAAADQLEDDKHSRQKKGAESPA